METIRVILSIAALKDLKIQQMDVKGAYLNGTLQEEVYMRQPEGYKDGSSQVCLLKKTLYGLKQSGREWNRELDDKLQRHNFKRLKSDPCVYIRREEDDLEVITVWVDDLLLFATVETLMKRMKNDIHSEWGGHRPWRTGENRRHRNHTRRVVNNHLPREIHREHTGTRGYAIHKPSGNATRSKY
jgi:hypothetical protein